jgi:DNA-binding NtrC family response regulator
MFQEKILVVDDEVEICNLFAKVLSEEGYKVFTAHNGKEALKKVKKEEPDLVLLDIIMPGMDGMEALAAIKKFKENIQVIMITAYGTIDTVIRAAELGAYDYVTKPFDLEKAKGIIRKALKGQERKAKKPALGKVGKA